MSNSLIFCVYCRQQNPAGTPRCSSCGKRLDLSSRELLLAGGVLWAGVVLLRLWQEVPLMLALLAGGATTACLGALMILIRRDPRTTIAEGRKGWRGPALYVSLITEATLFGTYRFSGVAETLIGILVLPALLAGLVTLADRVRLLRLVAAPFSLRCQRCFASVSIRGKYCWACGSEMRG